MEVQTHRRTAVRTGLVLHRTDLQTPVPLQRTGTVLEEPQNTAPEDNTLAGARHCTCHLLPPPVGAALFAAGTAAGTGSVAVVAVVLVVVAVVAVAAGSTETVHSRHRHHSMEAVAAQSLNEGVEGNS